MQRGKTRGQERERERGRGTGGVPSISFPDRLPPVKRGINVIIIIIWDIYMYMGGSLALDLFLNPLLFTRTPTSHR
jgi:hypothetical protein